jgi:hypothetical protein
MIVLAYQRAAGQLFSLDEVYMPVDRERTRRAPHQKYFSSVLEREQEEAGTCLVCHRLLEFLD